MNLEQEIRDAIERNKAIRKEVGQMNCTLSKLENKCEQYMKAADESYRKGYEDGKNSIHKGCEGCRYESKWQTENPCKDCSNCYKSQYEPMPKDELCFGDEIVDECGEKGIVVSRSNADEWIYALFKGYAVPQKIRKSNYRKTGVRRNLDSYFEET
jgi:hypothetical protein